MFGFKRKAKSVVVELSKAEHRPLARSIVAAGVYIAAIDGTIEDSELDVLRGVIAKNKSLAPFVPEANDWTNEFAELYKVSPRSAKLDILGIIKTVRNDRDEAAKVLAVAFDIADANGGIGEEEENGLRTLASELGLNYNDFV